MPQKSFVQTIKEHAGMISGVMGAVVAVVTAVIAVNSHFANAEDVKDIAKNQREAIQIMRQNSAKQLMFQMEYHENQIKQLESEKRLTQALAAKPGAAKIPQRNYDQEIADAKLKKEFAQKQLIEGVK